MYGPHSVDGPQVLVFIPSGYMGRVPYNIMHISFSVNFMERVSTPYRHGYGVMGEGLFFPNSNQCDQYLPHIRSFSQHHERGKFQLHFIFVVFPNLGAFIKLLR